MTRISPIVGAAHGLVALVVMAAAAPASAGGFATARFGGEHGHPMTGDPTAIYYNPAGLALESGHRIYLDANLALRTASYERFPEAINLQPPSDLAIEANAGTGELTNFLIAPFVAFVTDFGTGAPFGVGIGFYVPFGGQSVFDETSPVEGAPGSQDGAQRWWVIEGTIRSLALTLAGAYRIESIGLSIGLGFNVYLSEINTVRARNADGTDDIRTAQDTLKEGRSWLDVDSVDFGLGIGLMYEAIQDVLWLGVSYQSQPNFGADMELEGTLDNALQTAPVSRTDLIVTQELPDVLRLGARYRPMHDLELRLFGDWTRWSVFEQQCLAGASTTDPDRTCSFNFDTSDNIPDGSRTTTEGVVIQNFRRNWNDTFGVRLGASYWVVEAVELIIGGGYDSNAIADEDLDPALMDFNKATVSLGTRVQFTDWMGAMLTLTNVFYFERDTRGIDTSNRFVPPTAAPNSAGIYNQNVFLVNLGLEFAFGGQDDEAEMGAAEMGGVEPAAE